MARSPPGQESGARCEPQRAAPALIAALRHGLGAELVQTHISWVLLAGGEAWKIKKPVRLGFLDFGTLELRRRMCEEELRLNRRLTPGLYLAVVPITGSADAPRIGGTGEAIEYALHMRRFPAGSLLVERLAAGRLGAAEIDALALRVAAFHRDAPSVAAGTEYGSPARIAADTERVFAGLLARSTPESRAAIEALRAWTRTQGARLEPMFAQRKAAGWVREGHGDLHLGNTLVLGAWPDAGEVTAFDCIEFDPGLRWIDTMADIAFLVMDLIAHERRDLAFRFLDRYLAETGDYGGLAVLRYYLLYRACVRALVARISSMAAAQTMAGAASDSSSTQPNYLACAASLAQPGEPRLLVTCGVSGSGKSHAAAALLERGGAVRLRSDVERKRLHGLAPLTQSRAAPGGGIYSAEANARTYARLAELAETALGAGWPVIIDAAFLRAHERDAMRALASRLGVPFAILHCAAPLPLLRERIAARHARADDPSEADVTVLERQLGWFEPLRTKEAAQVIEIGSAAPLDLEHVAARWLAMR